MAVFTDDFERANGALGGNWSTLGGSLTISGGTVISASTGSSYYNAASSSGHLEIEAIVYQSTSYAAFCGPVIKTGSGANAGFFLCFTTLGPNATLALKGGTTYLSTDLATVTIPGSLPPVSTLKLVWEDAVTYAYHNGALVITYPSGTFANEVYCGISAYGSRGPIASVRIVTDSALGLSVSPATIPNFGECSTVTFTGTNTSWTPGTPGSPTFTVNHGTLSDQVITAVDAATATYCPGDWLGPVVFTDPSTGEIAAALVSSNPEYLPGDQCPFNQYFIDMANNAGDRDHPTYLVTENSMIPKLPPITFLQALSDIWLWMAGLLGDVPEDPTGMQLLTKVHQAINGQANIGTGPWDLSYGEPLGATLKKIRDTQLSWLDGSTYTLQDMLDVLRGTGDHSHSDIMAAISAIETGGDNSDVLARLTEIEGDPATTLSAIFAEIAGARTGYRWTLSDVKTWVEAVQAGEVDLTPVLVAIANHDSNLASVQTTIRNDIAGLGIVLTALQLGVGSIGTTVGTVSELSETILGIVQGLENAVPPRTHPLVSPGELPTYGDIVPLAEAVQIDWPMDGILIDVTEKPDSVKLYPVGDYEMIFRAGYCAFINPLGYVEEPQYLSFTQGIYIPKTCTRAAGVLVKPNQGQLGTVKPYRLAEPV